jgi:hypothetical protein
MSSTKNKIIELNSKIDKLKKERSKLLKSLDINLTEEQKKKLGDKPIMPKLLCKKWRKGELLTDEESELTKKYNNWYMLRYYYIKKNKTDFLNEKLT